MAICCYRSYNRDLLNLYDTDRLQHMIRVAILGASGYSALELIQILLRHPQVEITALTTRKTESRPVGDVHPSLAGRLHLKLENLSADEVANRADCVFCCLPHGASASAVAELLPRNKKVIDLSADYRLIDAAEYKKWYGLEHADPGRLGKAVYGLPEIYRERIQRAELVANPGCYPTSAILALAPLLRAGAILPRGIIVDSKSGVSGGGREPKAHFHFPECNESVSAYGVGTHRHMPEIDQVLTDVADSEIRVVFTPHLIPMDRGILSTCYAEPTGEFDDNSLLGCDEAVLCQRAIRARVVDPTLDEARQGHEFLRYHGPQRPRPRRGD